jgi:hypothetical protein
MPLVYPVVWADSASWNTTIGATAVIATITVPPLTYVGTPVLVLIDILNTSNGGSTGGQSMAFHDQSGTFVKTIAIDRTGGSNAPTPPANNRSWVYVDYDDAFALGGTLRITQTVFASVTLRGAAIAVLIDAIGTDASRQVLITSDIDSTPTKLISLAFAPSTVVLTMGLGIIEGATQPGSPMTFQLGNAPTWTDQIASTANRMSLVLSLFESSAEIFQQTISQVPSDAFMPGLGGFVQLRSPLSTGRSFLSLIG